MINCELSGIQTDILKASEAHRKGQVGTPSWIPCVPLLDTMCPSCMLWVWAGLHRQKGDVHSCLLLLPGEIEHTKNKSVGAPHICAVGARMGRTPSLLG